MHICGIIAEYDPLHNGHAWQMAEARRRSGAERLICAISCFFTQRGMPALFSPHCRAEMALVSGADVVLGLPYSFSVCDAERFALGGVSILKRAGADTLSFGIEPGGEAVYLRAATLLEAPTPDFSHLLRQKLDDGLSYPRAQGEALAAVLSCPPITLAQPNTLLAICYARANLRLKAELTLLPVPRVGAYHAKELPDECGMPSATAVRRALLNEQWHAVQKSIPAAAYRILRHAYTENAVHFPQALDPLLRWEIRTAAPPFRLPDLSEGLENRFCRASDCLTRDEMIQAIRSKRYPYARVSRLLTHLLMHTDARMLSPIPGYAYILGFRRDASGLLRAAQDRGLSLCPSLARKDAAPERLLDARAADLWSLGARQPFGLLYRAKPVIC